MNRFKIGDKVIVTGDWYKNHQSGTNKGVISDISEHYHITFNGCDCQNNTSPSGVKACQAFSAGYVEIDQDEARKETTEYQDKAQSLQSWFDDND